LSEVQTSAQLSQPDRHVRRELTAVIGRRQGRDGSRANPARHSRCQPGSMSSILAPLLKVDAPLA
jgi:hypothetical protein